MSVAAPRRCFRYPKVSFLPGLRHVPRGFDTAQALLTLGMMAFAIGIEAVMVVRRWRGLDDHSRPPWSPQQIATARHWRVALAFLLTVSWIYMGIALIEGANSRNCRGAAERPWAAAAARVAGARTLLPRPVLPAVGDRDVVEYST